MNRGEYHHVSQFILASAKTVFSILLYITYCTLPYIFSCTMYDVVDRTRNQMLLIKQFGFVFMKDLPSVSQLKVRAVTAENKEQHTLSNIIYNKFQNYYFSFELYFEESSPKMCTSQLTNGVYFFNNFAGWVSWTLPIVCSTSISQDSCADL